MLSCKECHAITQNKCPDSELANQIYSIWIDRASSLSSHTLDEYSHHVQEAFLLVKTQMQLSKKVHPSRLSVLDFGMGWGRFALAIKALGCDVFGYDLSEERVALGESNGVKMLSEKQIRDHSFDIINTEQVFEHLPNPLETARTLSSVLRKNGLLKISVPFSRSIERGDFRIDWHASKYQANSWMPIQPLEHLNYFRRPSLIILSNILGLEEVRLRISTEYNYAFDWSTSRRVVKNIIRPLLRKRIRNYYLFTTPAAVDG